MGDPVGAWDRDLALVASCRAGETPSGEQLLDRIRKACAGVSGPAGNADDLAGELYAHLMDNDARVLRSYAGRSSLDAWLHTVARHLITDLHRRSDPMPNEPLPPDMAEQDDIPDSAPSPEQRAVMAEFAACVRRALASLDPPSRHILVRHYVDGVPLAHLASDLGITPAAARKRAERARRALRAFLEAAGLTGEDVSDYLHAISSGGGGG